MFFLPVAAAAALVVLLGVSLATGHRRGAMPAQQPLGEALAVAQVDAGELVSPEMVLDTSVMLTNDELDDFNAELALALLSDAW